MNNIEQTMNKYYDKVVNDGYEIVGLFLQGSQNYQLDYEESDVDTKAIILPRFNDFCLNKKPISTTVVLENNEHIDLKDIRFMFDCFKKQNINFVEILFTKYRIINPIYEKLFNVVLENAENIARYNNYASVNCIAGMSMEKYKALEHPYPNTMEKIKKFGYDPKQLHHIIRLNEFIKRYIDGEKYCNCLISKENDYLIKVKKGLHSLEEARKFAKQYNEETFEIKQKYMNENKVLIDTHIEYLLNNTLVRIMKLNFQNELAC